MAYQSAVRLATSISQQPGPAQDAAAFEFVYGLIFVALQHLGQALDEQRWAPDARDRLLNTVCRGLMQEAVLQHAKAGFTAAEIDARLQPRLRAFEERARSYPLRVGPDEGQRPTGTLMWELPKQAIRSAGAEVDGATKLALPMRFIATIAELRPAVFADLFASAIRP